MVFGGIFIGVIAQNLQRRLTALYPIYWVSPTCYIDIFRFTILELSIWSSMVNNCSVNSVLFDSVLRAFAAALGTNKT